MKSKKNNPVKSYSEFVNEDAKMKMSNPLNKEKVKNEVVNPNTPLLNLFSGLYQVTASTGGYKNKFGEGCNQIRIGSDISKKFVYLITIQKLWDEELVQDAYGDDIFTNPDEYPEKEVAEAKALLGTPMIHEDDSTMTFSYFTDYTNYTAPAFLEDALRYAQKFYKLYVTNDLDISDSNEFIGWEDSKLIAFSDAVGIQIKSNKDLPAFLRIGYRTYQDSKAISVAENVFGEEFLKTFLNT